MVMLAPKPFDVELLEVDRRGPVYVRWLQQSLNRINGAAVPVDGRMGPRTVAAVRSFQSKRGMVADGILGPRTEAALIAAGASPAPRGAPARFTTRRHPEVHQHLPSPGPGYLSHKPTANQFGIPEAIRAIQSIGAMWQGKHPGGPRISIGDISLDGGGPMPDHKSHQRGIDFDVRPLRSDGREGPVTFKSPQYSRVLTQELVDLIRSNGVLKVQFIFFNDPAVHGVKKWPNHDNHLHVRFFPTAAPRAAGTRLEATPSLDRRGPAYVRWLQQSLNQVDRAGLAVDGRMGPRTVAAVRSFQRKRGMVADGIVGSRTEAALIAAGASAPVRGAPAPPAAMRHPQVSRLLPSPGPGYRSYTSAARQYGIQQTIRAIQSIGAMWQGKHPGGPRISIGDISIRGGGPMPPHVSHQRGIDFDVRPMRSDGREEPVTHQSPQYSRPLTQELVDLIRSNGVLRVEYIFFNDLAVHGVKKQRNHDNHLHVRFFPPVAPKRPPTHHETALSESLDELWEEEWTS